MRAALIAAGAFGLSLAMAPAISLAAKNRAPRHHVRHVRADKTIVPAPMQVDTSAHPRIDMPAGMQGVPTSTDLSPQVTGKRR